MNRIIAKIESLIKTDIRYLFKGGLWLTIGQGVSASTAFITSITFAHFVPAQIYGTYKYIQSIISIISNFTITGFSTSIIRSSATNNDGALKFSVAKSILWSIPANIIGLLTALYYMCCLLLLP